MALPSLVSCDLIAHREGSGPEHSHLTPEILFALKGPGYCRAGGRVIQLHPGDLLFLPGGLVHREYSRQAIFQYISLRVKPSKSFRVPDGGPALVHEELAGPAGEILRWILLERDRSGEDDGRPMQPMLRMLLTLVQRGNYWTPPRRRKATPSQSRIVGSALRYLDAHYFEEVSLSGLARRLGVTPEYFTALFHRLTGQPPMRYLNGIRVDKAMEMLAEDSATVEGAALRLGFKNPFHFSRVFKNIAGVSPNQYRKRLQQARRKRESER